MAYRLSEAGGKSVLVIEHGGTDAGPPFIQMPAALSYPMNMGGLYDWGGFQTEPEPHLGGRTLVTPPRGKVIGGSSSINGMVYVRGHARDFDHWAESGADGWSYADVLPYFKRMENWHDGGHGGDPPDWRGTDGPLHVTRGPRKNRCSMPLSKQGVRPGIRSPRITTAGSRKASDPLSRPSGRDGAGRRPTPI